MKSLLLDTHVMIWWMEDSPKLGTQAKNAILRPDTALYISSVSVWEVSIKVGLKRLMLKRPPEVCIPEFIESGFQPLPVSIQHALAVRKLPPHHADPFDRMLVAQAQCEDLVLLTADPWVRAYDIRTMDAAQ